MISTHEKKTNQHLLYHGMPVYSTYSTCSTYRQISLKELHVRLIRPPCAIIFPPCNMPSVQATHFHDATWVRSRQHNRKITKGKPSRTFFPAENASMTKKQRNALNLASSALALSSSSSSSSAMSSEKQTQRQQSINVGHKSSAPRAVTKGKHT